MNDDPRRRQPAERLPTGVAGLDAILRGGLLPGGIYLISGPPGVGKTTLGNQISFAHVGRGERAVYLTLLAESHGRMVMHLQSFAFFDPTVVGESLHYISGYGALESEGLDGLLALVRRLVREHGASLLVVDGLGSVQTFVDSPAQFRRFIQELHVQLQVLACTSLLLTDDGESEPGVALEIVDGVIELRHRLLGPRAVRELCVRKLRGSGFLEGLHAFAIADGGLLVHPRTEARAGLTPSGLGPAGEQLGLGVEQLDRMLFGGVVPGSNTLVVGPPGSGKTLLGLHFLAAGSARGEPGLYFGFREAPPWLRSKAADIGLDLSGSAVEVRWRAPLEHDLDELAAEILEAIARGKVRRLFLDGLTAMTRGAVYPERVAPFLAAFWRELRACGVTSMATVDARGLFDRAIELPIEGAAELADNLLLLRYVEAGPRLRRLVSIVKVREGRHETAIREFTIGDRGIDLA